MNILEKIIEKTRERVLDEKTKPLASPPDKKTASFAFEHALRGADIRFICEVKKASPSKGVIVQDFPYLEIARDYEKAGAAAVSVLTEPYFFEGKDEYLTQIKNTLSIPVLRKDFIIDAFQIEQAYALGADAVLLICSVLNDTQLKSFMKRADALGMSCLFEVHDQEELERALRAGARVIGANNRDLRTFKVDMQTSISLRKLTPPDIVFVSESGIRTAQDMDLLRRNHVNAVLVGETLMRAADKKTALSELRGRPL